MKCKTNYDCFYSPSIKYCKKVKTDTTGDWNEGECEWTWGFWAALGLSLTTLAFILILLIICILRNFGPLRHTQR